MPDVRGHRVDLPLIAVERERVAAEPLDPEIAIEALAQGRRGALEPAGQLRVVPDITRQASHPDARVVGVSLDLAGRDRSLSHGAITEQDGIPRVFPALVDEALGRARLIFEVAVAVSVAVALDPFERPHRRRPQAADEIAVTGPP